MSTDSKHTNGEWSATEPDFDNLDEVYKIDIHATSETPSGKALKHGVWIGTLTTHQTSLEEMEANARLFVHAPVLLAACEEVQKACSGGDWAKAIEATKNAIAQATVTPAQERKG